MTASHSQSQEDSDSPCELEVGEVGDVGEEMSLWTGGRVKAAGTLYGGGGGHPDQPDAAAFKDLLD
jgi:hypothetical protein